MAVHAVDAFGHSGKIYDGWETRRRREPGHDWAVVRLGVPGVVHGVVVDTAFFRGNYPPYVSVEATSVEGYPDAETVAGLTWTTLVDRSPCVTAWPGEPTDGRGGRHGTGTRGHGPRNGCHERTRQGRAGGVLRR